MDLAAAVQSYGYAAVGVGTFLEGETVLLAAGAAACHGYLSIGWVIVVAAITSFLGDQTFFLVGRRYGPRLLARFPALRPRAARASALLERYNVAVILAVRFIYGMRVAGPMAIGMSGVHWSRFLILNFAGAVLWANLIGGIGYGVGQGLAYALRGAAVDVDEIWLLTVLVLPALGWWIYRHARHVHDTRPH